MIIHIAIGVDPRGIVIDDGGRAFLLMTRGLRRRQALVESLADRAFDARSRIRGENQDLERLLDVRRELVAWDHVHVFDGLIRAKSDDGSIDYVIGYTADLPHLSLNAVLLHCFATGLMDVETFASSFAYVAHSREGFVHLDRCLRGPRRAWCPESTTILLSPRDRPGVVPYQGDLDKLGGHLHRYPDAAIQPALVDGLVSQLRVEAEALGIRTEIATRSDRFFEYLENETEVSQTLLLAHQHSGWIQFDDRLVSLAEVHEAARAHPRGGAWYLAVCGSDGPSQLAGVLQGAGRPVVVTGGMVSVVQDQLGFMLSLLRVKARDSAIGFERALRHVQLEASGRQ